MLASVDIPLHVPFQSHDMLACTLSDLLVPPPPCYRTGAILLTRWMNPMDNIQEEDILAQLDSIAEEVAKVLLRRLGGGGRDGKAEETKCVKTDGASTCSGSSDVVSRARDLILPERAVTDAINAVMYGHLGFRGAPEQHYYDLENSFIDKVCLVYCNRQ